MWDSGQAGQAYSLDMFDCTKHYLSLLCAHVVDVLLLKMWWHCGTFMILDIEWL